MVRNFAEFDWNGETSSDPPGREVAEVIHRAFTGIASSVSILDRRDDYGWEFDGKVGAAKILVVFQPSDRWLAIVDPVRGIFDRLFRSYPSADLVAACRAIHSALTSESTVGDIRWFTEDELKRRSGGSADPGYA